MKTLLNLDNWNRKAHFQLFSQLEEPFFGVTITIDCTTAYQRAKERKLSFFLYYLYRALKAANEVEPFRYGIIDQQVYIFDQVNATPTIDRADGTFGFGYIDFTTDETLFYQNAQAEIEHVRNAAGLKLAPPGSHLIQFSAIPWLDFTSLSHARGFKFANSSPKISFGKLNKASAVRTMPVSIHVHHGLMDARDVATFVDRFQELMDQNSVE